MKCNTTTEQRKAWAEVHKTLIDYIVNFGPIEVKSNKGKILLDEEIYFLECGKIKNKG